MRVLIVEDEPPARRKLRRFLEVDRDVGLVDEARNGDEAVEAMRRSVYDVVFLDVQMPGRSGLDVLAELGDGVPPVVIFVTAHDRYAVRAFEVRALDYLLKPFDEERFRAALERAKRQLDLGRTQELKEAIRSLTEEEKRRGNRVDRLMVKESGRVFFVKVEDITWLEAASNYVQVHLGRESHLVRESFEALLARLDPSRFVRVHRSYAVNLDHVREMYPWSHGDYRIVLDDGTEVKMSRRYKDRLPEGL